MLLGHLLLVFFSASVCRGAKLRGGGGSQEEDVDDRELAMCKNTAVSGAIDHGCSQELPICVNSKGRFLVLKHVNGGKCARCVRLPGKWPFQQQRDCSDFVCPYDNAQCDKAEYKKLNGCKRDFACPPDRPQCLTADYTAPKVWFAGMMCIDDKATCYNNADLASVDFKCTAANPVCVKADGSEPALHSPGNQYINPWHVYSTSDDFDNSNTVLVNVGTHIDDQLNLNKSRIKRKFIWVLESNPSTIVKINTETGVIVGRYWTAPAIYDIYGGFPIPAG